MTESDEKPGGEVLTSLPSRRPQRRSRRRDASDQGSVPKAPAAPAPKARAAKPRPAATQRTSVKSGHTAKSGPGEARSRRKPAGVRPSEATRAASSKPGARPANAPEGIELVGTAVQAAGELAQLGLTLGTKALRGAISRIPRP